MEWTVEIGDEFEPEFDRLDEDVWRVAFAFDLRRKAILLVGGDKSGGAERRFYRELIRKADDRFDAHLARQKEERGGKRCQST